MMVSARSPDAGSRYSLSSVDNALWLLLYLEEHATIRITDAARELEVSPSTAHRLLTTMSQRGFVVQDRLTRAYRMGPVMFRLGLKTANLAELRDLSEPHLRALVDTVDETVNLLVLQGDSVRFLAGFEHDHHVQPQVLTGVLVPAYATAGGKVLLADLPQGSLRKLYPHGLRKLTRHTRTYTQLIEELALVPVRGFAVNKQESKLNLSAVGVPLKDHAGDVIASVSVSMPSSRMSQARSRELVALLRGCAGRIRENLPSA